MLCQILRAWSGVAVNRSTTGFSGLGSRETVLRGVTSVKIPLTEQVGDASRSLESKTMITRRRILAGTGGIAALAAAAAAAQGPNVPTQARNGAMQIPRS